MKDGSIIEVENVSHDPERMFCMSRNELMERVKYEDVQAIWHTHPKGKLSPSKSDIDSIYTGTINPSWEYLIATADGIFQVDAKTFAPKDDSFWGRFK